MYYPHWMSHAFLLTAAFSTSPLYKDVVLLTSCCRRLPAGRSHVSARNCNESSAHHCDLPSSLLGSHCL